MYFQVTGQRVWRLSIAWDIQFQRGSLLRFVDCASLGEIRPPWAGTLQFCGSYQAS